MVYHGRSIVEVSAAKLALEVGTGNESEDLVKELMMLPGSETALTGVGGFTAQQAGRRIADYGEAMIRKWLPLVKKTENPSGSLIWRLKSGDDPPEKIGSARKLRIKIRPDEEVFIKGSGIDYVIMHDYCALYGIECGTCSTKKFAAAPPKPSRTFERAVQKARPE